MDIKERLEEFVKMYENECYNETNKKCLALDEQELSVIHMCLEILEKKRGYDINNYVTKDLFILLKDDFIDQNTVCDDEKVRSQPIRIKKIIVDNNYSLSTSFEAAWVFYALVLLYANDKATTKHNGRLESKRQYLQVYAFFSCICPKVFCALFFNQIYLFMKRIAEEQSLDMLSKYFADEKHLWFGYEEVFCNRGSEVSGKITTMYSRIVNRDQGLLYQLITRDKSCTPGFLAYDYKSRDFGGQVRIKKVVEGIGYFQFFLSFFEEDLKKYIGLNEELYEDINLIRDCSEKLKKRLIFLLESDGNSYGQIEKNFSDIEELLVAFKKYCDDNMIVLINV